MSKSKVYNVEIKGIVRYASKQEHIEDFIKDRLAGLVEYTSVKVDRKYKN